MQQGSIKLIKGDNKDNYIYIYIISDIFVYPCKKKIIQINAFLLNPFSTTIFFNIVKKYFLSSKSAYYHDFIRIMWHWRLAEWLLKIHRNITF